MAQNTQATQNFVPIKEVRDGFVVLDDGSMRAILLASSVNFALKSADEQQSIIMQFQSFLNSLDFSIQFFIESRQLDIRPYIALLEEKHKEQATDLMKIQTREYIDFVKKFTENSNIMSKSFFVVVPYGSPTLDTSKPFGGLFGGGQKTTRESTEERFEESRSQLEQRISVVEQGLIRTGIRVVKLGTEEVIELFYKIFNPGDLTKPMPLNS